MYVVSLHTESTDSVIQALIMLSADTHITLYTTYLLKLRVELIDACLVLFPSAGEAALLSLIQGQNILLGKEKGEGIQRFTNQFVKALYIIDHH